MTDLTRMSRPGYIWSTAGGSFDWKHPFLSLGAKSLGGLIVATQKRVFCKRYTPKEVPGIKAGHTTMYFDPACVFSTQWPKPTFIGAEEYEKDQQKTVSVFRMNPMYFRHVLTDLDAELLHKACRQIVGWNQKYDIGQDLDILIETLTGYPFKDKARNIFDAGTKQLVCSVSVAMVIASWRHELKKFHGLDLPQPWKRLRPAAWTNAEVQAYPGHWDIGQTYPANYETTKTHFSEEFQLIGRFRGGKLISRV